MGDQHNAEVARLEAEIERLRPSMVDACAGFVDATAIALRALWPGFIDDCVKSDGEGLKQIEAEGRLPTVKAKVESIMKDPRGVAQRCLVDENRAAWPHLSELDDLVNGHWGGDTGHWVSRVRLRASAANEALDNRLRIAAAAPAAPLTDAGMNLLAVFHDRDGVPSTGKFDWTTEMEAAADRYAEFATAMHDRCAELRGAREERERSEAQDLWHQT